MTAHEGKRGKGGKLAELNTSFTLTDLDSLQQANDSESSEALEIGHILYDETDTMEEALNGLANPPHGPGGGDAPGPLQTSGGGASPDIPAVMTFESLGDTYPVYADHVIIEA